VIAGIIEAGWEVIENTSWIIDRYRGETAALDYFGDSIINSTADMAMMVLGFLIAWRAPVWVSITLFIAAELIVGYIIRDGLCAQHHHAALAAGVHQAMAARRIKIPSCPRGTECLNIALSTQRNIWRQTNAQMDSHSSGRRCHCQPARLSWRGKRDCAQLAPSS
jgi:hypothetical protein